MHNLVHSSFFNLYTEKILREVEVMNEVIVDVVKIIQLKYVNGTALLTLNEKDLQDFLAEVNDEGKLFWMKMNAIKTKTTVISRSKQIPKIKY